jgi:hypothetical protein
VALTILGPPAPLAPSRLVPVGAIMSGGPIAYELSGDTLYTAWFAYQAPHAGASQPVPSRAALDAYGLADGRLRWRVLLPVDLGSLLIRTAGPDTVVVSSLDLGATGTRTVAYDADSGRLLWDSRLPLVPTATAAETVVLGAYLNAANEPMGSPYVQTPGTGTPPAMLLQALYGHAGTVAWTLPVTEGSYVALPAMAALPAAGDPYAVVIAHGGEARSVNLTSGAMSEPGQVPLGTTRTASGAPEGPELAVSGPWLLVGYQGADGPVLSSYRVDTLAPAWSGPVRSLNLVAAQCGPLTCLTDRFGTQAVDLATGRVRWDARAWQPLGTVDGWIFATPQGGPPSVSGVLLAPGSGDPALDLTGWAPVRAPATGPYLVRTAVPAAGGAWLGVLHVSPAGVPRVEPVAPLADGPVDGCTAVPEFVVCGVGGKRLWIWRYHG